MSYNQQEIRKAIKRIDDTLKIPYLQGVQATKNKQGKDLLSYAGGYNVVYQLVQQGKKWAFRVSTVSEPPLGKERLQKIDKYLKEKNLPYFVTFIYEEKAIEIKGELVDATLMEWIDGKLLKDYIKEHLNKPQELMLLADNFLKMCQNLQENKISHGDLQHENIIIVDDRIKLIDYDSICVPSIEGEREFIAGKASYQHPSRSNSRSIEGKTSLKTDYFSQLIIYLSIFALAENPKLWEQYDIENQEDNLLFSKEDFLDYPSSEIYKSLEKSSENIRILNRILLEYLKTESYLDLQPFYIYLVPPKIHKFTSQGASFKGETVELFWEVSFFDRLILEPIGDVSKDKSYTYTAKESASFTLIAKNYWKEARQQLSVEVFPEPSIVFEADKKKINIGETVKLSWEVKDAYKVQLSYDEQKIDIEHLGSHEITPKKDTTFYLLVTSIDKQTICKKEISIKVFSEIKIIHFEADKPYVYESKPITFNWEIQNATRINLCSSNGIKEDVSKEKKHTLIPHKEELFWLEAHNDLFSKKSETISIVVDTIPRIPFMGQPINTKEIIPQLDIDLGELTHKILGDSSPVEELKAITSPQRGFSLSDILKSIFG